MLRSSALSSPSAYNFRAVSGRGCPQRSKNWSISLSRGASVLSNNERCRVVAAAILARRSPSSKMLQCCASSSRSSNPFGNSLFEGDFEARCSRRNGPEGTSEVRAQHHGSGSQLLRSITPRCIRYRRTDVECVGLSSIILNFSLGKIEFGRLRRH
jgi:hypothetical protein